MSDQNVKTNEREWWDSWNTSHRSNDNNDPVSSELFERTAQLINDITAKKDCRVLEIGCGTGTLSRRMRYSSYHGIDLSAAGVEIARQKALHSDRSSSTSYEAADFHEWPLPSELFDVVVCVDAVAYFYDQQFALKKISESLTKSGALVLTTINPFIYNRIRRTAKSPLKEGSVSRWLSRRELHRLIEAAQLNLKRSYTIMPRGDMGFLRVINAQRLNGAFGPGVASVLKRCKEQAGLGQYRVVMARKEG